MQNIEISLLMKRLCRQRSTRLAALGLAAFGLLASTAAAGDKIVFSDDKPKAANPNEAKPANELFRSWNTKLETPAFDYSILGIPTIPRANSYRNEDRRAQAERAEKKNWMLIEPGQLQKKEEERSALGVANKPLENLDKDDGEKKDYTFYNLRESKDTQQRQPGEIRSGNQTPSREEQAASAAQQREREDSDAEPRRDRTFSLPGTQPGARNSGELSLPGLFDPGKRDALSSADSKSEFSLPGLFANAPARTDKDNARMKNFNDNILNSGPGLSTPAAGNSLILPQSSASFARPQDNFSSRPAGGNLFDSGASLNSGLAPGLPNRLASPGFLAPNNSAASPGASPFFSQGQAQQNPSRNWSAPAMEPPRRKF